MGLTSSCLGPRQLGRWARSNLLSVARLSSCHCVSVFSLVIEGGFSFVTTQSKGWAHRPHALELQSRLQPMAWPSIGKNMFEDSSWNVVQSMPIVTYMFISSKSKAWYSRVKVLSLVCTCSLGRWGKLGMSYPANEEVNYSGVSKPAVNYSQINWEFFSCWNRLSYWGIWSKRNPAYQEPRKDFVRALWYT